MTNHENVIEGLGISEDRDARQNIDVDVIELRLPCRYYRIHYKVAETGQFSLTTEFLLRLLRLGDGMSESDIGRFFAFTSEETRFVVDYVEGLGFAMRRNGRVFLTDAGHAQFRSSDSPALFEVHLKQDRFEFDIISWAPAESRRQLSLFESKLPELSLTPSEDVGHGSSRVVRSFPRYFQTFRLRRGSSKLEKETLYSIDDVQAEQRYSTIIPVTIAVRPDDPSIAEATLVEWKDTGDLQDRPEIVDSCASFARDVSNSYSPGRHDHTEWMRACAPELLERFVKNDVLDAHTFFSNTSSQAGELRSDRPTVRVIGNLWTDKNGIRLATALKNAARRGGGAPKMTVWLRPQLRHWGTTTRLDKILDAVRQQFTMPDSEPPLTKSVLLADENAPKFFRNVFQGIVNVGNNPLGSVAEIFLVPGYVTFFALHHRFGAQGNGYPIPLGVLSFDPGVVGRATELLKKILAASHVKELYCDWNHSSLLAELDQALTHGATEIIAEKS